VAKSQKTRKMHSSNHAKETWGDYKPVADHVFYRVNAQGREVFVLSAEKTWDTLRTNLITLRLQAAVVRALG
jgi:hypothetical protein